jgi:hypothetical protein
MKRSALLLVGLLSGCASYVTPGGPVKLDDINRADIAEVAARRPAANFPARIAVVRVQAPDYRSPSTEPYASGRFSIVTAQELMLEQQFEDMSKWPQVVAVAPVSRLLLPASVQSLDDLRVSAAKLQADVLLVYTVDTLFKVSGRSYAPLALISLGLVPDRDAYITATASAVFVDVRTGFTYGAAEGTARASELTNVWGTIDGIDRRRLEVETKAFRALMVESTKTWAGIARAQSN